MDELYELEDGILLFDGNSCTKFQLYMWVILVIGKTSSFYSFSINILLEDGLAVANALGLKFFGNTKTFYRSYLF